MSLPSDDFSGVDLRTGRDLRVLFLHRGRFSGSTESLIRAWRQNLPEADVTAIDTETVLGGPAFKLLALPVALLRGGPRVLVKGKGRLMDAVKNSEWFMRRMESSVLPLYRRNPSHFVVSIGTMTPIPPAHGPVFVYTDQPVLGNRYFTIGQERVDYWAECIPFEKQYLERAVRVFTMSTHAQSVLVKDYSLPADKAVCVGGGPNVSIHPHPDPKRFENKNILFVGIAWETKGGPELVKAFLKLYPRHPDATLTVVGCRPDVDHPAVRIVGRVPPAAVPEFYARAAIFCMPTHREAMGMVYLEAMHHGLPVVGTCRGPTPDYIIDGQTGFGVEPLDVDMLAARLDQLLANPERCRQMGRQGRTLAESRFTWDLTQRRMWTAIREALGLGSDG